MTASRFAVLDLCALEDRRVEHGQKITDAGLPQRPLLESGCTVAELAAEFVEHISRGPRRLAPKTRAEYERILRSILLPEFRHLYLAHLSPRLLQQWIDDNEHRRYQVNRALAVLSSMYRLAERLEYALRGTNPVRYVDRYDEEARSVIAQPESELPEFWRWTAAAMRRPLDRRCAVVLQLIALTGCRPGEIQRLRLSWLDLRHVCIVLPEHKTRRHTKADKTVWLSPQAVAVLARHIAHERLRLGDDAPVFRSPLCVRRVWETCRDAIGAPHLQLRDLRRTFDTLLHDAGVETKDIASIQSRTEIVTRKHYIHPRSNRLRQIAALGGQLMKGEGGTP